MLEPISSVKVADVLTNPDLSRLARIEVLLKLREEARAEQRLASEGGSVDDDGLNADLRDIEIALERLKRNPAAEEGKGPASL
jgi:hypothetical protein